MVEPIHYLQLETFGGVEQLFHNYILASSIRGHRLILGHRGVHPAHREAVMQRCTSRISRKHVGPFKLPGMPGLLRRHRIRRFVSRIPGATMVFWNQFPRDGEAEEAQRCGLRIVYFDHGAAWSVRDRPYRKSFLNALDQFACNSLAGVRVLQLRLGVDRPVTVISPGLRPGFGESPGRCRPSPRGRPVRLGLAGRLVGLKGVPIALHAVKRLRSAGMDCELLLAGEGERRGALERLRRSLGLGNEIRFLGWVEAMGTFLKQVDLLLAPSIHESFGLTCLEAAASGCPVIAARVDGLPEAVAHGTSGWTVAPTLALRDYRSLGGDPTAVPERTYDPDTDRLTNPLCVDPDRLAAAVHRVLEEPGLYERLSEGAVHHAWGRPSFQEFTTSIDRILDPPRGQDDRSRSLPSTVKV